MYELKIITRFAAAHQLQMVAKQCENLHGHNWKIEVYVKGKTLNKAGVLIDFGEVKTHLKEIIGRLDHRFLNELEAFATNPPSSENVAHYIAHSLADKINTANIQVSRVAAWESEDACATYFMD